MEDFVSTTDVLVGVLLFWNSLLAFFTSRQKNKKKKRNWFDVLGLVVLVVYWIGILVFAESVKVKLFVSVLMFSSLTIRLIVLRSDAVRNDSPRAAKS